MRKKTLRTLDLQSYCFVVDERPLCVWDLDIHKRTIDFLDSLDPEYYDYIAEKAITDIDREEDGKSKKSLYAALLLRFTYSQALETLFSLIGSAVQASWCIPAWINAYKTSELISLIKKIDKNVPVLSMVEGNRLSWRIVGEAIFQNLVLEDKEKEAAIKKGFIGLWSRLSSDFLNDEFREEYNSIKHGLRIHPGGFYVAIGANKHSGEVNKRMTLLGRSIFGTSFVSNLSFENVRNHLQIEWHNRNWDPEDFCYGLKLISLSISNIISALKIVNGVPAEEVQFHWPNDLGSFDEPWTHSKNLGVTSMHGVDVSIRPDFIDAFSKEQILQKYKEGKFRDVKHVEFEDPLSDYLDELSNSKNT